MSSLHEQDNLKASSTTSSSCSSSSSWLNRFLGNLRKGTYSFLQFSFETSFRVPPPGLKEQWISLGVCGGSLDLLTRLVFRFFFKLLAAISTARRPGSIRTITKKGILNLASAVFFYGHVDGAGDVGLFDLYDLIKENRNEFRASAFVRWAGYLELVYRHYAKQLLKSLSVGGLLVIAIALGQPGIDALLIASQVVLSVVSELPFISFPSVHLTSKKSIMCVRVPASSTNLRARSGTTNHENLGGLVHATLLIRGDGKGVVDYDEKDAEEKELNYTVPDYSNNLVVTFDI
ncbi:hypothetical protein K435DRAFT_876269 [Dendrothele bispora CBS 962.96]|uniref:Uncharacterized protein n=1 Tax=Dendrothele bispora (strain CBS 962.96) TaxID=1314807 RepID=A0A4S8KSI7_DENBC|nr:hypothetical protein K435DRAFT_876269 [Dendrothele bispora CBS 962.96]